MSQNVAPSRRVANSLLVSLHPDAFQAMAPHLEMVDFPLGRVLFEPGDAIEFVYFPRGAVLSLLAILSDGSTVEMATVGCEGMLGLIEALGDGVSRGRCIVQMAGPVSRMRADHLRHHGEENAHIRRTILHYIQFLFTQTLQAGVCSAVHSVEARCCRIILTMCDHIGGNEIPLTHEFLADMLGVHRPAVSIVAHHLQDAGLIKQQRGKIIIIDSTRLEEMTCECYRIIRRNFERLLPPSAHSA
jgi:CRP-like cAMP-binding protein